MTHATSELPAHRLARIALTTFVLTFLGARILVLMIMTRRVPDLYAHVHGTHVHHLNYGIFLLSIVGAWLLFGKPAGRILHLAAGVYGVGLALTFDEFGMWLHLGGPYWQRASFDAVVIIAALLGLLAVSPSIKRLAPPACGGHRWPGHGPGHLWVPAQRRLSLCRREDRPATGADRVARAAVAETSIAKHSAPLPGPAGCHLPAISERPLQPLHRNPCTGRRKMINYIMRS